MQFWKMIILNTPEDFIKKKILPAIYQFSSNNEEKILIDLTLYSNTLLDTEEIKSIFKIENNENKIPGIKSLKLIKNENNYEIITSLIENLEKDERLIIYSYNFDIDFLNFIVEECDKIEDIDILLEKPLFKNYKQIKTILDIITKTKIQNKIRFCDHYLFKTETNLPQLDKKNLQFIKDLQVKKIEILALEKKPVKDTLYYEQTGCFKDMFIHLLSLIELAITNFTNLEEKIDSKNIQILSFHLGQYQSYTQNPELKNSKTETYFKTNFKHQKIPITIETGKKLKNKITKLKIIYENGSILIWNIYPFKKIEYFSLEQNLSIFLDKNSNLDYTNILLKIMERDYDNFLEIEKFLNILEIIQKFNDYKKEYKLLTRKYNEEEYPVILKNN